jgi:hypothetical protein
MGRLCSFLAREQQRQTDDYRVHLVMARDTDDRVDRLTRSGRVQRLQGLGGDAQWIGECEANSDLAQVQR